MGHLRFLEARLFADTQAPSEAASAAREAKAIYTRSTSWYYRRLVEEWEGESLALAGAVPGTGTRGVFARALTDDERRELSAVAESQDTFAARRAWIIVLSADKMGAADIAKDPRVAMDQGPVRKVINDFNRRGLAVLCRGRHRRADAEQTRP